ncbi:hypothetical protein HDU88_006407 [Geranomyces variabilis]|nr:hypothetical protein HDU88_006407 [Geranomyces variabilis]
MHAEEWDVEFKAGLGKRFSLENMLFCQKCYKTRPHSCFPPNTPTTAVLTATCTDCRALEIPHRRCYACNKLHPTAAYSKTQRHRQQPLCQTCAADKGTVWSTGDAVRESQIAAMNAAREAAQRPRRDRENRFYPYGSRPASIKPVVQPVAIRLAVTETVLDDGFEFDASEWADEYEE